MWDSQAKDAVVSVRSCACVALWRQAAFHYVLVPWGFATKSAAVTIVRFETVLAGRGGYSQRVVSNYGYTPSYTLYDFDPFLRDSENDY